MLVPHFIPPSLARFIIILVSAKNFTAGFPHLGQRGIKQLLDKNSVKYMKKTIKQAIDLKEDLEKMSIKRCESSIVTLDIEAMYPSIQFIQVKRAVEYFLRNAPEEDKVSANQCLEMIRFGMANTIITYGGKYYEYGGEDVDTKGLTIGGYESAFLADLVAAFILENTEDLFEGAYSKIYRDDGVRICMEKKTTDEVCDWLELFQGRANTLTGSDSLKFTMEIWNPDAPEDEVPRLKKVEIVRKEAFPYLDLEMYWRNEDLQFRVHVKENQALKYLNRGSNHTNATFKAIPMGVCRRLVSLTSVNADNENKTIDELYPEHFNALRRANLISEKDTFPTLRKASDDLKAHIEERNSEERQEKRQRNAKDNK
eukprot:scaffold12871_cov72-Skeletonema_dohrnii-CCMP3373.AAC.1